MPKTSIENMNCIDWKVTLINFLKYPPRRNLVPLNYVVRDNVNPITRNNPNFLYDYANINLLQGKVFNHDVSKVHSCIICLISENTIAEQKVFPHKDNANGREYLLDLKDFYEGVGANSKAILSADNNIQEVYYAGKKKPHMWWDEFEIRMTNAFAIDDKDVGSQVHTDKSKLRLLNKNIRS